MKQCIVIEIDVAGSVTLQSNISDKVHIRNILKLAEEIVVTEALRASSEDNKIIPAKIIPKIGHG